MLKYSLLGSVADEHVGVAPSERTQHTVALLVIPHQKQRRAKRADKCHKSDCDTSSTVQNCVSATSHPSRLGANIKMFRCCCRSSRYHRLYQHGGELNGPPSYFRIANSEYKKKYIPTQSHTYTRTHAVTAVEDV